MTTEIWRPVLGWEGSYSVSDQGGVRSEDRIIVRTDGVRQALAGQSLTPNVKARTGHRWISLCYNSKRVQAFVHHLVLEAFVSPRPSGLVCRHLDDNPANNHVSNLTWGTVAENNRDIIRNGHHRGLNQTHCKRGHIYAAWNLTTYSKSRGLRACLACKRARHIIRYRNGIGDMTALADAYFAELAAANVADAADGAR